MFLYEPLGANPYVPSPSVIVRWDVNRPISTSLASCGGAYVEAAHGL